MYEHTAQDYALPNPPHCTSGCGICCEPHWKTCGCGNTTGCSCSPCVEKRVPAWVQRLDKNAKVLSR